MMPCLPRALRLLAVAALAAVFTAASAQTMARRLSVTPSASAARVPLAGTVSDRVAHSAFLGHLPGYVQLTGMSLMLRPTAAQSAAMDQLLADQQNPASSSYHQWLTPEQFGTRFGLADEDLAVLQDWLRARGFTVDSVAPSRNRIVFTGTAAAVENAFGTTMQRYKSVEQTFFENSSEVQIPAALAEVIGGISGLSSYRLQAPMAKHLPLHANQASSLYTTSSGLTHYMVPWDVRQIFGSNMLINAGFDGTGIKIGVLGQSAVSTAQLTYFQQKTGQTVKLPTMVLVPGTGASNMISGDEGESELDLEYASGSAPGATVLFIYTGCGATTSSTALANSKSCSNNGVFDSLAYAVTNKLAPILTLSYGACETSNPIYINTVIEPVLKQANTQGQTFLASSGDTGAAACEGSNSVTVATGGLSVSYPASSAYATGVGGTQLSGTGATYWNTTNNSFGGSAIGYIPEIAWNDTGVSEKNGGGISTSGGGISSLFAKPSWQTGPGVIADAHRDVPDVSLPASAYTNGYLVCTADAPCSTTSQTFQSQDGGVYGGTSASAPNLAAILAIIEQANGGGALGNINPSLYTLASGASGSSIFHDVTSGNNVVSCQGGTTGCSSTVAGTNGTMGYNAGTGYDRVTGLGSIAVAPLQVALSPSRLASTVTLTLSTMTPTVNTAVTLTAKVTGSGATPTGSVVFSVDGTAVGSAVPLSSGTAAYSTFGFNTTGPHTVTAIYTGDASYAESTGTSTVTATAGKTASSVTLTLPTTTLAVNTAVAFTAQVTPGATGTVIFSVDGMQVGSAVNLVSGSAGYTYGGFPTTGTHTVSATYSGDATFNSSATSTALTVGTGKLTASVYLTTPGNITTNSSVSFGAYVTGPGANQLFGGITPTGTVIFSIDGTAVSPAITINLGGPVAYVYNGFTVAGTHTITANYSGDASYAPTTTTVTVTVVSVLTAPVVTVNAGIISPTVGVATTLTVAVGGSNNVPTGTVTFSVDGTTVGSAVGLSNAGASVPTGSATIAYTFTTGGAHTVAATYSGDSLYTANTGTTTITAITPVVGNISVATSPPTVTVAYGNPGQVTVTVASVNSYTGPVSIVPTITASSGAAFAGCYSVSNTINPLANATASATLTITATPNTCPTPASRSVAMAGIAEEITPLTGSRGRSRAELALAAVGLLGLIGLRRRILPTRLLLFSAATALAVGLGGCSGGGSSSTSTATTSSSSAGTYTVRVTATSAASASISASSSFTLIVR